VIGRPPVDSRHPTAHADARSSVVSGGAGHGLRRKAVE